MLPMAGQVLARTHPGTDILALSACIVVAQLVMTGMALVVGRALQKGYGRKTIFLCCRCAGCSLPHSLQTRGPS
jgi:hypothetical protein